MHRRFPSSRRRRPAALVVALAAGSLAVLSAPLGLVACARPDLLRDVEPLDGERVLSVVIENPAGTREKWEVDLRGRLEPERRGGQRVEIEFLPWPVNGAMIPRTLLSRELGGDGEPLDVLVLGEALPRGSRVRVRAIGLLRVVDRLERDDKIIAVPEGGPFAAVDDVEDLGRDHPGVLEMLTTWYRFSRPGGGLVVQGYGSRGAAYRLVLEGIQAFAEAEAAGELVEWRR